MLTNAATAARRSGKASGHARVTVPRKTCSHRPQSATLAFSPSPKVPPHTSAPPLSTSTVPRAPSLSCTSFVFGVQTAAMHHPPTGRRAYPSYVLPAPFHTALDLGHQGCFALRFRADQAHSVPFAPGTRRPADPVHVFDEVWCHLVLDDELDVGHIYPPGSEAGADEQTLAGGGEPVEGSLSIGGWHVWMEALGGLEARTAKHAPRLYSTGDGVGED
mmetsp:Transcript_60785/g.135452  ORF Transcript_60785/g.135452 Transcript_60785/m.135452 type:complete len:218 (+) Transcript_60785:194-847(+)